MSDLSQFERLAQAARGEHTPRIDVAARVAATVNAIQRERAAYRAAGDSPLLVFAGLSLAAAVLVGMLALPCWESLQDPLVAFCKPLTNIFE